MTGTIDRASKCYLVTSGSAHSRLLEASRWLDSLVGPILVLAPNRASADEFAHLNASQGGGRIGIHRLTLAQLAAQWATTKLAEENLAPLSPLASEAICTHAISQCLAGGKLGYFSPVASFPGFPRALASTLRELRLSGVSSAALSETSPVRQDLANLMDSFELELSERGLADYPKLLALAAKAVRQERGHPFSEVPILFLDLPLNWSLEQDLARALAKQTRHSFACLPVQDEAAVTRLSELFATEAVSLENGNEPRSSLNQIQQQLFRQEKLDAREMDATAQIVSAADENRECVEIARRIQALAEKDIPFDEIAIFTRDPGLYQPLLQDALRRADVPTFFSQGSRRPDPAGRALLALLYCAVEGLSATRFSEYLSLGQLPACALAEARPQEWVQPGNELQLTFKTPTPEIPDLSDAETEDEDNTRRERLWAPIQWERMLVDSAVIGGCSRWKRRLKGLEAELRLRSREVQEEEPKFSRIQKQIEQLLRLKGYVLPLVEFLDQLPQQALWGDWLRHFRELANRSLFCPQSVLEVLAELQPMAAVGPTSLQEATEVLVERLSFLRVEPPRHRYGRVYVGTMAEAAGRSFQIVFVPGLAEGIFPRKMAEDPLLLDQYRADISAVLPSLTERIIQERLHLQVALGAASKKIVVSYPRMDLSRGRARVPSFYALDVWRAGQGRLPSLGELEQRAAFDTRKGVGWQAPAHPKDAIDETEYDLAVLANILSQRHPTKGSGRFLLEANQHLKRSLRARARRWLRRWTKADGLVSNEAQVLEILAGQDLAQRSYSPTALQNFAICPYRFLLHAVHRLKPREEVSAIEQMDPLTRGSLFHRVQFELLRLAEKKNLLPFKGQNLDLILNEADSVLDSVSRSYQEDLAPAVPRVWDNEVEDLRIDLRSWIRQLAVAEGSWKPYLFEYSFGLPLSAHRDPRSSPDDALILGEIRLRGSIDLVERDEEGALRVVDHKTGRPPFAKPRYVGGGEHLQPALYGLAAQTLLETPVESGHLHYCTQRGDFSRYQVPLDQDANRYLSQVIESIRRALKEGFLPAAPREKACQYCDYKSVCGPYEEIRVRLKPAENLRDLKEMRDLP